jgi:uronate dehydrogenase
VSKVYGEAMAQYYWDKYGLESISVRIYSCFPEPLDRRMLTTWLSYNDLRLLIDRCLWAPSVRHTIIHGVSNNTSVLIDNHNARHIGFHPQDTSEIYREKLEANTPEPDPKSDVVARHGGQFTIDQHFDD